MASLTTVPVTARVPSDFKQALLQLAAKNGTSVSELLAQLVAVAIRDEGGGFAAMLESAERQRQAQDRLTEAEGLLATERKAHEDTARALIEMVDKNTGFGHESKYRKKLFAQWERREFKPDPNKWP